MNVENAKKIIEGVENGRLTSNTPYIGYQFEDKIVLDGHFKIAWLELIVKIMKEDPEYFGSRL